MKREIITTGDGSVTIYLPEMKETYHSKFGAVNEAYHVFIQNGLAFFESRPVSILEIGFGTGLNAFITYLEAVKKQQQINYTAIEAYPVEPEEALQLNYPEILDTENARSIYTLLHSSAWEKNIDIDEDFTFCKRKQLFEDIGDEDKYDLIYFDAFGYHAQPELWDASIFKKMFRALKSEGVLVTYACRTVIKKAMEQAGFTTKKVAGPPGKREMLIAKKGLNIC